MESIHGAREKPWAGDANDRINGGIAVRLRRDGLALTLRIMDRDVGHQGDMMGSGGRNHISLDRWLSKWNVV